MSLYFECSFYETEKSSRKWGKPVHGSSQDSGKEPTRTSTNSYIPGFLPYSPGATLIRWEMEASGDQGCTLLSLQQTQNNFQIEP
ncbi:hypothetical protein TREES_T100002018 [Tupaia chinensis]|uniref:Uncharacterized protein n=1 Tax=Tupaia chinensis TaxID=246437 RepID=L9JAK0_TUPCH|nr:hypothetical protein TREES_T100002018 [Tupaia chinensis]